MTAPPPVYSRHVWWARRPLVASRAAILASRPHRGCSSISLNVSVVETVLRFAALARFVIVVV
jgi:hypothetical protein